MKKLFIVLAAVLAVVMTGCKNEPDGLSIDPSLITCPDVGGDYTINVVSPNGAWTASSTESWIRVTPASGEQGTTEIRIKITANKESTESTGAVVFTCGDEKVTLPVTRAAKAAPYLYIVSETEYNTPKEGGTYTVLVESNIKWQIASNASWAKVDKGVSVNDDRITVTVSAATTPEETTAVLTVKPYGEGEEAGEQTVTITRGSTDATSLSVDPVSLSLSYEGGPVTIDVSSTAKWRVYKTWDMDWVEFTGATEGEGDGSFGINVQEATSTNSAYGVITIEEVRSDNYPPVVTEVSVSRAGKAEAYLSVNPTTINATAEGGTFPVEIKCNYPWTATLYGVKIFSTSITSGDGDAVMNVTVKPTTEEKEYTGYITITSSFGNEQARINIRREAYVEPEPEPEPEDPFCFTVSDTKKVYFSPGNLQYRASTNTWRFAEHQYDFVGDAERGTVIEGAVKCNNEKISDTYTGWIDLFSWGTGNNPTKNSPSSVAPYANFVDWGTNAIANGGNAANQWRTLTKDEWVYLFSGRTNAATLFGLGSVNGVKGTILLPDNWELPTGASFAASTTKGLTYHQGYYSDIDINHYTDNTYTTVQWETMESAGAVFLPAAGARYIDNSTGIILNDVSKAGDQGHYWSATARGTYDNPDAYYVFFLEWKLNMSDWYSTWVARSVRLVRDAQ